MATHGHGTHCIPDNIHPPAQVTSSEHIDAKRLLLLVPHEAPQLLEVRALLLERLGRHQDALQ